MCALAKHRSAVFVTNRWMRWMDLKQSKAMQSFLHPDPWRCERWMDEALLCALWPHKCLTKKKGVLFLCFASIVVTEYLFGLDKTNRVAVRFTARAQKGCLRKPKKLTKEFSGQRTNEPSVSSPFAHKTPFMFIVCTHTCMYVHVQWDIET